MNTTGNVSLELPSDDLIQLDQMEFPHPWTRKQWLDLSADQHQLFTYRENGKLIGFALFGITPYDDSAHLYKILLLRERRGSGVSELFWSSILEKLRGMGKTSVYLEVQSSNQQAIRFYQKCNFSLLRKNKAYYSNGEDALIMSLTL